MMLKKLTVYVLAITCSSLLAQENVSLLTNWDYKRKIADTEKINQAIATSNGYIVAVGETISESYQDQDGLIIVLDAFSGDTRSWKRFGGVGDQSLSAAVQNLDGTLTLVGSSKREEKESAAWIVKADLDGEILDEQRLQNISGSKLTHIAINNQGECLASGIKIENKQEQALVIQIGHRLADVTQLSVRFPNGLANDLVARGDDFYVIGTSEEKDRDHPQQIWLQQINSTGKSQWSEPKYFGDRGFQEGISIASGSTLALCGVTNSQGEGMSDIWLINLDDEGNEKWQKTYGGHAADVASDVVALSNGGFAILGYTWSHMPRAKQSSLTMLVTDADGNLLDDDFFPIVGGRSDNRGFSVTESLASSDLVIVGNTVAEKNTPSITLLSSISYLSDFVASASIDPTGNKSATEEVSGTLEMSSQLLMDENQNSFLERGERGYVEMSLTNPGPEPIKNVVVRVSGDSRDLDFWEHVYLGSIFSGQEKKLRIPMKATANLSRSNYELGLEVQSEGKFLTRSKARVSTNEVAPANLIVNTFSFSPDSEPSPGERISLTLQLSNIGGLATDPLLADFNLPAGVSSGGSERVSVPAIKPNGEHEVQFNFVYDENFTQSSIQIEFETNSTENVVGIKKSFSIALQEREMDQPIVAAAVDYGNEIFWTAHEEGEMRSVEVSRSDVQIKALAVAGFPMAKKNFAVIINGRRSQGQKLDETKLTPPKSKNSGRVQQSYVNNIRLTEGFNEVQLIYYAEDGKTILATSSPLKFNYIPQGKPNLHVISIGVKHDDLAYTVDDARAFANMYAKLQDDNGRGFKRVKIYPLLTDEETTVNNIKAAFQSFSRDKSIKDNDLVVVFISSHGKVIDGDRYVLLPSDYDPEFEDIYTVDFNEDILKRLRNVDGNKLVFIDACHSGSAGSRSFSDAAASKVMNDLITATSGMEIFASCGDREFSYEDESWGNGAFTKAILEAFENKEVEVDGKMITADIYKELGGRKMNGADGVITIEELKNYVQQRVPYLVKTKKNKPQNPRNKSTELLPRDMGIFMVNN